MSQPARLLVCDDNDQVRELVCTIAAEEGYETDSVSSGEECIEFTTKCSPDLVLLDIRLAGTSGLEVCAHLKKDEKTRNIPIIFVSALSEYDDILRGYELGGDDYITKPINVDEARIKVKHILNRSQHLQHLQGQVVALSNMAQSAMNEASFIGAVAHFATQTAFVNDYDELANSLIEVVGRFGLKTKIITFTKFAGELQHSRNGINDKEVHLMLSAREIYLNDKSESPNRFQTLKNFILAHSENAVILAKPLPVDEVEVGQIRDVMGHLSALYSTRINDVDNVKAMTAYLDANKRVIEEMSSTVGDLEGTFLDQGKGMIALLDNLLQEFEKAVHQLLLSEEQEKILFGILEHAMQHITATYTTSLEIDGKLNKIMRDIKSIGN